MPQPKREEAGSVSKQEHQIVQKSAADVCNFFKVSILSVSNVRLLMQSEPSDTKFSVDVFKMKRMEAFAGLINKICCIQMAHDYRLATHTNSVDYLLVLQDLFDWIVDVKKWKQKIPKKRFVHFQLWLYKNRQKQILGRQRKKIYWRVQTFCTAEGTQKCSRMIKTKTALTGCTLRSLKNMLYRYTEDLGHKHIHNLPHFITTLNSRKNCPIDSIQKNVRISYFLSILYSKPLREYRKPKFETGDTVWSRSRTYTSDKSRGHSLHRKFLKMLHFCPVSLQH